MWWWWRWLKRQRHYAEYRQRLIIGRLRALSTWIMIIRWWMVDFTQFWCKNEQSFKYKTLSDKQSIQLYLIKSFNSIFQAILRENWEIYCLSWYSTSDYSISLESKAFFHLNFFLRIHNFSRSSRDFDIIQEQEISLFTFKCCLQYSQSMKFYRALADLHLDNDTNWFCVIFFCEHRESLWLCKLITYRNHEHTHRSDKKHFDGINAVVSHFTYYIFLHIYIRFLPIYQLQLRSHLASTPACSTFVGST